MPIYEYRCKKGHTFEVVQRMTDDPVTACNSCSAAVQRVFHPIAVHFKGSGFYNTDYGKQKRGGAAESSSDSSSPTKDDGASKKDSGAAKDSGAKKDTASSSSSSSSSSGSSASSSSDS